MFRFSLEGTDGTDMIFYCAIKPIFACKLGAAVE
jgi:hypothetical protein